MFSHTCQNGRFSRKAVESFRFGGGKKSWEDIQWNDCCEAELKHHSGCLMALWPPAVERNQPHNRMISRIDELVILFEFNLCLLFTWLWRNALLCPAMIIQTYWAWMHFINLQKILHVFCHIRSPDYYSLRKSQWLVKFFACSYNLIHILCYEYVVNLERNISGMVSG